MGLWAVNMVIYCSIGLYAVFAAAMITLILVSAAHGIAYLFNK